MDGQTNLDISGKIAMDCAFCRGTGIDPFGLLSEDSRCQVCGGRGEVIVRGPVRPCAYCSGKGVHIHRRLTCTVCSGKGVVPAGEAVESCAHCHGKGFQPGQYLPCLTCGGKGVVAKK
mgnify:CR=1 FL=1